jgi:PAS domain S-box-containing protein
MEINPCILIVDDDESQRKSLSLILKKKGYEAESAGTGKEALEKARDRTISLALLDIKLPDTNGIQLVAPLRQINPDMAIIMVTGFASIENTILSLNAGASGYLVKPVNHEEMLAKVKDLLERQELISEKRLAEASLQESEERFRLLLRNANDGIFVHQISPEGPGKFIEVNDQVCTWLGYSKEEMLQMNVTDIDVPEQFEKIPVIMNQLREKKHAVFETEHLTKDKKRIPVEISARLFALHGKPTVLAVIHNITARKRAEAALRESEERFRKIFENSPLGIALVTPDFRFFSVNPLWVSMTGYSENELLKMSFKEITHPDHLAGDIEHIQELVAGTIPVYSTEKRYIRKDGSILWGLLRVTTIRDQQGSLSHFVAQIDDITGRKRAEEALHIAEEKYTKAFLLAPDAITVSDLESGRFIEVNDAATKIFGFSREELIGKSASELGIWLRKEDRDAFMENVRTRGRIGDIEIVERCKSGELINLSVSADTIVIDNIRYLIAVLHDVTGRKQAENALRKSEEKFRNVFDWANDAVMLHTLTTEESPGRFIDVNRVACRMLGYTRDELLTKGPPDIVPAEFHPLLGGIIRQAAIKESVLFETRFLRKDGTTFPIESSGHLVSYEGKRIWLSHIRDITERKQADEFREQLNRELSQKNADLDRFTYTVSHDLKSPLITIRSFLGLLKKDLQNQVPLQVQSDIDRITSAAETMEHLITTLLALSRSGRSVDAPVSIPFTDLAREAAGLLEASFRQRGVTLVIPDNLPVVSGDRQRLLQMMINLLDNAVKFMGDQKEPRVEVGVRGDAGSPVFLVKDNGIGFKKENLSKVFGLFERFNPDVPGTGIGLSTVKRIIEAHSGKIWMEAEGIGKGTAVCFTLPVVQEKMG